jgi:hypothetical protein
MSRTQIDGLVPLSEIVYNALNDIGDYSLDNYKRYMQWVIRKVTDMKLNISNNSSQVVYLTMSDAKTSELPSDYMDYVTIGVRSGGKIWTLTERSDLIKPQTVVDGEEVLDTQYGEGASVDGVNVDGACWYGPHWYGGVYYNAPQYAIGGGTNSAYFSIDKDRRRLIFNGSTPRGEVVLEYISSGISADGINYVERSCLEYLLAFLHVQRLTFDNSATQYKIEKAEQRFNLEERRLVARANNFTVDEFKDILRKHYKQVKS